MYVQSPEGEWERPSIHTCLSRVLKTSGTEQVKLNQQIHKHIYQDTDQESGPSAASNGPKAAAAGNASSNFVQGTATTEEGPAHNMPQLWKRACVHRIT